MIRVVIDTSVLVSAVISPTGPNAQLFDFFAEKEIRPYVTEAVLAEYRQLFEYERLQYLDKRRIRRLRSVLERPASK
jgi:putative PIN family toxin of toxin-antitoxin system